MLKLNKYNTWEGQSIQVKKGLALAKPVSIVNIYRPPKDHLEHYKEFIDDFSYILDKLEKNTNEVIISSVFNIHLLEINDKQIISEYFGTLTSHSFYPKITVLTKLTNNNGTLKDNCFM